MGGNQSMRKSRQDLIVNPQAAQFVQDKVKDNCVTVFSKSSCPYCKIAQRCLDDIGAKYEVVELSSREDMSDIQDVLMAMTGERTVPQVFINGSCIGGGATTKMLHQEGRLRNLVQECGGLRQDGEN
ncbi:PREDICTED: glutaredoxin-2, mitochondrial-like [Branchiostoma belcheri]|uniref:Glutaredoxin-2, mitochondrial n=1 Tax=Branchiostoma belcheri TaxID=7741 RepID=A0A6P4YQ09_BRABE|nr:PREDICTED: glutaredoxin-2, mitochondrial-like [Branchiostoma belcheri]